MGLYGPFKSKQMSITSEEHLQPVVSTLPRQPPSCKCHKALPHWWWSHGPQHWEDTFGEHQAVGVSVRQQEGFWGQEKMEKGRGRQNWMQWGRIVGTIPPSIHLTWASPGLCQLNSRYRSKQTHPIATTSAQQGIGKYLFFYTEEAPVADPAL